LPIRGTLKRQKLFSFPVTPTRGSAPKPRWGFRPKPRLALRARHESHLCSPNFSLEYALLLTKHRISYLTGTYLNFQLEEFLTLFRHSI